MSKRKVCHACVSMPRDFMCGVCDTPAEDVSAVVDEPVGYAATSMLEQIKFSNVFSVGVPMRTGEAPGFEPLYRRPQRKVVMPERRGPGTNHLAAMCSASWNACLDKFIELNK